MSQPYILKIDDDEKSLTKFEKEMKEKKSEKQQDIILNYPTVYIHNWDASGDYDVYIGESNNIIQRTRQHYAEMQNEDKWQYQLQKRKAELYIIGHEHFNKSLTLDIENRLMLYLMSVDRVRKIHNRRGNPQNKYYPEYELDDIFQKIWRGLRKEDPFLFPSESKIEASAVFKASPLHKLTDEQEKAKDLIIQKVFQALHDNATKHLIFIEGETGSGKTVLNSSTFYEIYNNAEKLKLDGVECYLLVNHDEQITVYEQIAKN